MIALPTWNQHSDSERPAHEPPSQLMHASAALQPLKPKKKLKIKQCQSSHYDHYYLIFPSLRSSARDWAFGNRRVYGLEGDPRSPHLQIRSSGLAKEDVKLQVHDDRLLHISAETKEDEEVYGGEKGNNYKWHCKERVNGGSFCREFRLPENGMVDEIKASMSDGVLVVTLPKDRNKRKKHGKKHVAVEISGKGDDDSGSATKGLGRFVCCKA
ncbi:hypothetical protein DH2020_042356 [Rehmannia glutinosa]|uniref:SHSP domain-containing protein n=1 Tax=Rehmannia glutinosa TaxID=99300 RepID=A0ABR0UNG9_REHGL